MIVKTRIFKLGNSNYRNLSDLAHAMGISVSQIYRIRQGKRNINQKFIVGAIRAFPRYKLDELFYLVPEPDSSNSGRVTQRNEAQAHSRERTAPGSNRYAEPYAKRAN